MPYSDIEVGKQYLTRNGEAVTPFSRTAYKVSGDDATYYVSYTSKLTGRIISVYGDGTYRGSGYVDGEARPEDLVEEVGYYVTSQLSLFD